LIYDRQKFGDRFPALPDFLINGASGRVPPGLVRIIEKLIE
jgi:hypothetical protein